MRPFVVESEELCRVCSGSAMVANCGRTDAGSDGPCVLRGQHFGPCWGEGDVASDWTPASSCKACCVCPCGSTDDGSLCRFCGVQMKPGYQPPVFSPSTHRPAEVEP